MSEKDEYKVTYSFSVEYENVDLHDHPKHTLTVQSFDGTDVTLDVVLGQVETFLKAAGYYFDHLEVVKDSYLK
jgi:hypothetical protein